MNMVTVQVLNREYGKKDAPPVEGKWIRILPFVLTAEKLFKINNIRIQLLVVCCSHCAHMSIAA